MVDVRLGGLLMLTLWLSGCAIGPSQLTSSRMAYNDAVQRTEQRELLLNIVRLRYHETPEFLAISGISSQFELSSTIGVSSTLDGDGRVTSIQPEAELGFAERPTITFTPQQGPEFTRQLIAPVGPETLYRLIEYGWGLERIFGLAVRQINSVGTPIGRAREASGNASSPELRKLVKSLAEWQRRGLITLNLGREFEPVSPPIPKSELTAGDLVDAAKEGYRVRARSDGYVLTHKTYRLTLQVDASLAQTAEWQRVAHELSIAPSRQSYAIDLADKRGQNGSKASDTLYLATRSPLGMMAYLSQGVDVPIADERRGEVEAVEKSLTSLFRVRTADEQPRNAFLAISHRGHWFYVQADDLASRQSLGALISLLRLELEAGGAHNVPVLTLPVGQ